MGDKKFKTGVDIQSTIKISSAANGTRAVILNGSKELIESSVTQTELERLSGIVSALIEADDRGAVNGVASLDGNGKVPSAQLPALAITEVFVAATIAARDALTVGTADGEIQEGDVVIVTDASADVTVDSGAASYIYDGSAYQRLLTPDAPVISVNTQTGAVVLDSSSLDHSQADVADWTIADDSAVSSHLDELADRLATVEGAADSDENIKISANDTTAGYLEDKIVASDGANTTNALEIATLNDAGDEDLQIQFDEAKVDHDALLNFVANEHVDHSAVEIATAAESGLAGGGDITATRNISVDIAGTTAEASVEDADLVLIYDDSATALKSMSRANFLSGVGLATGDIAQTSFSFANNQVALADVTGLVFANADVRSFVAEVAIERGTTYEHYTLTGVQLNASWAIAVESVGDDTGVAFDITTAGQVQYTSTNATTGAMKFRAKAIAI
jgi:hypothetical protein